jgi:hypothetical protein
MTFIDEMAKGVVGSSDLSTALTKPIAELNGAMTITIKALEAWQTALTGFEKVLAEYGVKVELPSVPPR